MSIEVMKLGEETTPIETILYWANAYADPASGEHFMGHGVVHKLLSEYAALRQAIEQAEQEPVDVDELKRLADAVELRVETRAERMVIADKLRKLAYTSPPPRQPEQDVGEWRLDHSAGRPILVYKNCSVIEADDAEYVLRLIKADLQQKQEPVAIVDTDPIDLQLYPPQRQLVGLTTSELDEIDALIRERGSATIAEIYRAIEAKLKEKNT